MTSKKPVTPEEQWKAIEDSARDAEVRELEAQTEEETDAILKAHGVDLEAFDHRGDAFVENLLRELGPAVPRAEDSGPVVAQARAAESRPASAQASVQLAGDVVPLAPRSRFTRWTLQLLAAAIGIAVVILIARPKGPDIGPDVNPSNEMAARQLRREAKEACAAADWEGCLAKLDDAKRLDPTGESVISVKEERAQAAAGIRDRERTRDDGQRQNATDAHREPEGKKGPGGGR